MIEKLNVFVRGKKYLSKGISGKNGSEKCSPVIDNMNSYRSALEVLRWANPKDVLLSCAKVCSTWTKASESSELWISFCEDEGIETREGRPKESFQEAQREPSGIPVLKGETLRFLSLDSFELKKLTLQHSTAIDSGSAYCQIGRNTVLSCGGATNQVYKVNIRTGAVEIKASMTGIRTWPGVFKYKRNVYVIGGKCGMEYLASGERFSLQSEEWTPLTEHLNVPMHSFTPCIYQDEAFIVGSQRVETFNLISELFTLLLLELPKNWWYCLAVIRDDELIIIQRDALLKWKVNSRDFTFRVEAVPMIDSGEYWSNFTPVWKGEMVFSIHHPGRDPKAVLQFDFDQKSITPVFSFNY